MKMIKKIVGAGIIVLVAVFFSIRAIAVFAWHHGHGDVYRIEEDFVNGDIIFQTSRSRQSEAIQLATHSKYSHCGMIFWDDGQCFVIEAGEHVDLTPIDNFIRRGENEHFVVKRLKNASQIFTTSTLEKMTTLFYDRFSGKPYDLYFEWSDDKIYCSELVWKLYKETVNIEIGELQRWAILI